MSYAETYAELTRIDSHGGWVEIDTDMGEIILSAREALSLFDDLAPGEALELIREVPLSAISQD